LIELQFIPTENSSSIGTNSTSVSRQNACTSQHIGEEGCATNAMVDAVRPPTQQPIKICFLHRQRSEIHGDRGRALLAGKKTFT